MILRAFHLLYHLEKNETTIYYIIFFSNSLLAIDPVVIGTMYQNDIEVNLSIIENLNKNRNQVEIIIKKDIRTKIKKRENSYVRELKKNIDPKTGVEMVEKINEYFI